MGSITQLLVYLFGALLVLFIFFVRPGEFRMSLRYFFDEHRYVLGKPNRWLHLTGAVIVWGLLLNVGNLTLPWPKNLAWDWADVTPEACIQLGVVEYGYRLLLAGLLIGLTGALFQVIAIRRYYEHIQPRTIIGLSVLWGGLFALSIYGMAVGVTVIMGGEWTNCLDSVSASLAGLSNLLAGPCFVTWMSLGFPFLVIFGGAFYLTLRLWNDEKNADSRASISDDEQDHEQVHQKNRNQDSIPINW